MGTLYIVATPIGNLEDITLRAIRVLKEVPVVFAEDTRIAGVLLRRFSIQSRLVSYNDHNKSRRLPDALAALHEGDVALVSDAGTPAISDPGVDLVAAARAAGHTVVPLPGASAVTTALSAVGLRARTYRFAGFLPRQEGSLRRFFESLASEGDTTVAFESPKRLPRTLGLLAEVLPNRRLAVCRELTKLHEEIFVGTAAEARSRFEDVRGEVVLVIEGSDQTASAEQPEDESALRDELRLMRGLGLTRSQATALLASRYPASRRRLYQLWLEMPQSRARASARRRDPAAG